MTLEPAFVIICRAAMKAASPAAPGQPALQVPISAEPQGSNQRAAAELASQPEQGLGNAFSDRSTGTVRSDVICHNRGSCQHAQQMLHDNLLTQDQTVAAYPVDYRPQAGHLVTCLMA